MKKEEIKVSAIAGLCFIGMLIGATSLVSNEAQAHRPEYVGVQTNPNPARILNRTDINTKDGRKELLTVETIPGVVCVITTSGNSNTTTTSCVSYRP
jgi:hypothetical protein